MSSKNIIAIAMSFVGLLVGAGFATGQEVVQYFTAFGTWGIPGIIIAALVMTLAGTVFLQLGSYFHASEHNTVFRNVTHPIVSKLLDVAVIITLFAIGFVMLAGAGSNMEQQFGWKTWIGSTLMLVLVLLVGMLDVDKVSKVIGTVTPSIIIAVIGVAIYTGLNMPDDIGAALDASSQIDTPIGNWLISALNYNGLALMLAVSMSLVIGGDNISPREAGWGGVVGGIIYSVMMGLAGFSLLMNSDKAQGSDIPMLSLVDDVNPTLGAVMAVIIYLMIFNTAIGMFYALGKRLSAGFKTLMNYIYPIIGYMGILMVAILVFAWFRSQSQIQDEAVRRERVRALMHLKLHPDKEYDAERYDDEIGQHIEDSNMDNEALYDELVEEVTEKLDGDDDVDFDKEKYEEKRHDYSYYTERDAVETDRTPEEIEKWVEETGASGDPEEDEELPQTDKPKN